MNSVFLHKFICVLGHILSIQLTLYVGRLWLVSSNNNSNKLFALNQLVWIGVSIGLSFVISRLLPFPISLVAIVGVFLLLGYFMRSNAMRKIGMRSRDGSGIFGSRNPSATVDRKLKYYCLSCGIQHNHVECPKCGSKMKRVGAWSASLDVGNRKEKCTALDALPADMLFCLASTLKHQSVVNVSKKPSHLIQP